MSTATVQKIYGELLSLSVAERFEVVQLAMGSLQKECANEYLRKGRESWERHDVDTPLEEFAKPVGKTPKPGCMRGRIRMADDFDAPLEEFEEYM